MKPPSTLVDFTAHACPGMQHAEVGEEVQTPEPEEDEMEAEEEVELDGTAEASC